jgi:hypothetical protein
MKQKSLSRFFAFIFFGAPLVAFPSAYGNDSLERSLGQFMTASQQVTAQVTRGNQMATECAAMTSGMFVSRMNAQLALVVNQRSRLQRGLGELIQFLDKCQAGQNIPAEKLRGAKESLRDGQKNLSRVYEEARSEVAGQRSTILGFITCDSRPQQTPQAQALFAATLGGLERMSQLSRRMEETVASVERGRNCP